MSTDADVTFDDLMFLNADPTQAPTPSNPDAAAAAAGPMRARSHVNVEVTRASLRAQEAAKPKTGAKNGQFYRPELHSVWDRITRNLAVRIIGITVLAAVVVAVVVLAVNRF